MNNILDTITVAIDGESVLYFVAQTTAPIAYDGFGTISVLETYGGSGESVRVVLIRDEHFNWQNARYNSGLFYATHFDKKHIAQELWKRLAGQSQLVADAVRAEDKANRKAEKEAWDARMRAKVDANTYRGWRIVGQAHGRFGIRQDGNQPRNGYKSIENAKASIDAIVG
jgi:hypothetical protein